VGVFHQPVLVQFLTFSFYGFLIYIAYLIAQSAQTILMSLVHHHDNASMTSLHQHDHTDLYNVR